MRVRKARKSDLNVVSTMSLQKTDPVDAFCKVNTELYLPSSNDFGNLK